MNRFFTLCIVACLIAVSGCRKPAANNGTATVTMQLNPMWGTSSMALYTTYAGTDSFNYNFILFKLFLSHIKLIRADGTTVEVKPVAYCSSDYTPSLSIPLADSAGSYTGIQFHVGLDSIQDGTPMDTTSVASTDPFSPINNMFWTNQLEYVFVRLEGHADTRSTPQNVILYHVGTSPYYTSVTVLKNFTVSNSSSTILNLNVDLKQIFYGGANPVNVSMLSEQTTSTTDNYPLATQFMTNLSQSFSLR